MPFNDVLPLIFTRVTLKPLESDQAEAADQSDDERCRRDERRAEDAPMLRCVFTLPHALHDLIHTRFCIADRHLDAVQFQDQRAAEVDQFRIDRTAERAAQFAVDHPVQAAFRFLRGEGAVFDSCQDGAD